MRVHYAIVFVADMARSVAFYRDVLGLPVRFESTHWTELEAGGVTLALHLAEDPVEADGGAKEPPGRCRPGFEVADLGAFHRRMVELGVACLQEPKAVFGARLAIYRDPDGLAISVGEARGGGTPD